MAELFQKLIVLFNGVTQWFNENISAGFLKFIKALLGILVKIFQFLIDSTIWIINKI